MTIVDTTLHNVAVRGDRTARYHFGDTIAKTRCDADIAIEVEQFSREGRGAALRIARFEQK